MSKLIVAFCVAGLLAGAAYKILPRLKNRQVASSPLAALSKKDQEKLAALKAAGMNRFDLTCTTEAGCSLNVKVDVRLRDVPGDLDFMRFDAAYGKSKRVLVTVESLNEGFQYAQAFPFNFDEIAKGVEVRFDFPPAMDSAPLMLSICRDGSGTGKCAGKTAVPLTKIITGNLKESEGKPDYLPPDRIYFAQYLFVFRGRWIHYFKEQPSDYDAAFAKIAPVVFDEFTEYSRAALVKNQTAAKITMQNLTSFSLEELAGSLVAVLPQRDIAKLQEKAK